MKLYITRHGETDWNKENRVLGRPDIPLNETGRLQAQSLALKLKDIPIDKVYASPLSRASETAEIAVREKNLSVIQDKRLIEQSFGIFEGRPRDDAVYQEEKYKYFKPFENGESFLDVAARVYPFLQDILTNEDPDASILIVTHGGIARVISNYFHGMENKEFASFFMKNCELLCLDIQNPGEARS